jgi:hypothetical protein
MSAMQSFAALTRLDLTRCGVAAVGISAIAATVPSLQELSLSENGVLRSFTELRSLQQLSRLTRLDLSSPSTAMRMPESEHTAVCELTQLRHLAFNSVMLTRRCVWSLQHALFDPNSASRSLSKLYALKHTLIERNQNQCVISSCRMHCACCSHNLTLPA